jgi:GT2 family glycosyltransferase
MLDILVATYNRPAELETVLFSLAVQEPALPSATRVVICDDGAPVSAEPVVRAFRSSLNVEFHRMERNVGIAAVRRFLVGRAVQDLILWVDDDVVLHPRCVGRHVQACVASTGPILSVGTMEEIPESIGDHIMTLPLQQRLSMCEQSAAQDVRRQFCEPGEHSRTWRACWTGNLMMRKASGDEVGWIDDGLVGWGYDDTVLMVKLVAAGVRARFDASVRGYHVRRGANRGGNLGKDHGETARVNEVILQSWLQKLNIT